MKKNNNVKNIEILQLYKKTGANPYNSISTRLNTGNLSNRLATSFNSNSNIMDSKRK